MLEDRYFATKQELTDFAFNFRQLHINNWYVRTTFECGHDYDHRKQGILLIRNERCIQRLIICTKCKERIAYQEPTIKIKEGGDNGTA